MSLEALKREVCERVDAMGGKLLTISRAIHATPELAFHEVQAAALLTEAIEEATLPVERRAYGLETAFVSRFGPRRGGEVALLLEYDALPGMGHACGHNLIATASLGAGLALAALGDRLPGCVRLLGTPAEEAGGGKELMAQAGAFEGVDAALMVHPAGVDLVTMPCIAVSDVDVIYRGKAAHAAAMPERGINALDALVLGYQAINVLRPTIGPAERLNGIITDGGQAANVIPDRAAGNFTVRAANLRDLEALKRRVEACFQAGATATGAELQTEWAAVDYQELRTCWPLAEAYQTNAELLGRSFFPYDKLPPGIQGSTDMGNVSHRLPSIHPMIAAAPLDCTIHHPDFAKWAGSEMGDRAALDGAKALAMTALDFFCDADLRDRAARAFRESSA